MTRLILREDEDNSEARHLREVATEMHFKPNNVIVPLVIFILLLFLTPFRKLQRKIFNLKNKWKKELLKTADISCLDTVNMVIAASNATLNLLKPKTTYVSNGLRTKAVLMLPANINI
jgi:hypothetical protein